MKARHKRLGFIAVGVVGLGLVLTLLVKVFNENLMFFHSPSEVAQNKVPLNKEFRLGGLVEEGSVKREDDGLTVHFRVTDNAQTVQVTYTGILPDLFREGQGVIAQGKLSNGVFNASEVLAKHDETYMPPEVQDALDKAKQQTASTVDNKTN
ncbi:MAG: cytochrome c maturation protein CcmE [Gammaproteobacteria bacterium]|nr:cytochrome c maturation protein CcmE [Gammaproteobacteria bacterium]MDH5800835.1 cytochrome c maturation protein CcmE [Gammaproteobacteria bacterium]